MPKSRFNAVRERARATRHNPVGRKGNTEKNGAEGEITNTTLLAPRNEDILPILKSLPLDDSADSKAIEPTETLWALTSITGLLSNKASRTLLLAPQHSLLSRVLLQLNSRNHVQLREAASGCLRNLCIEAGGKIRKILENKGCIESCLEEIELTAKELGFIEGPSRVHEVGRSSFNKKTSIVPTNKPKEEMNRKEKRLAAKADAAGGKKRENNTMEDVKGTATQHGNGLSSESNGDDEHRLQCCSHLTNLIAILWCMAEVSSHTVNLCHKSASILSNVFSAAIRHAVKSTESLFRLTSAVMNVSEEKVNNKVDVGKQDQVQMDRSMMHLALMALNALVTLTDSDQEFSAAFVGVSRQELQTALKGKKKRSFVVEKDGDDFLEAKANGTENLGALSSVVSIFTSLPSVGENEEERRLLRRQATSLALLSLATIRNIQSCLPGPIRDILQLPVQESGTDEVTMMSINAFELQNSRSCLTSILIAANRQGLGALLQGLQTQAKAEDGQEEMSIKEKQAGEELNNMNLALEILAELAGDRAGWNLPGSKRKEVDESIAVDDEGDESMLEDDEEDSGSQLSLDPQDEEMFLDDSGEEIDDVHFADTRIAKFFNTDLIDVLLALGTTNQDGLYELKDDEVSNVDRKESTIVTASLRSISIRALSVLNNQFLVLASFARPPPSQAAIQEETIKSLHAWLRQSAVKEQMSRIWRWHFELASRVAALPCLVNPDDLSSEAQDGRNVVEIALCIMWSMSRCYEGMVTDGGNNDVLSVEASAFADDHYCRAAQSSLGVVDSLIAAYKSSKRASTNSMPPPTNESTEAPTSFQTAPSADGIRIHSLGILSTLLRQPATSTANRTSIVTLLVDTLDVLSNGAGLTSRLNALQMADVTSVDGMVVAVNGLIDTFADENSSWDPLYSQLKLQQRLRRASVDVRHAVSCRDLSGAADQHSKSHPSFFPLRLARLTKETTLPCDWLLMKPGATWSAFSSIATVSVHLYNI
jgi:hypothetical protein